MPAPSCTSGLGLAVVGHEVREVLHALAQNAHAGQVDHAEVVGLVPVEALARHDEDALLMQQVERELLVVGDVELLDVDLGEDVEGRLGLDRGDARISLSAL